jgi:hypothetical protein
LSAASETAPDFLGFLVTGPAGKGAVFVGFLVGDDAIARLVERGLARSGIGAGGNAFANLLNPSTQNSLGEFFGKLVEAARMLVGGLDRSGRAAAMLATRNPPSPDLCGYWQRV